MQEGKVQGLLKQIHEDLKSIEPRMAEADDLLGTLEAAGEDVTDQRKKIRELRTRQARWNQTLAARLR